MLLLPGGTGGELGGKGQVRLLLPSLHLLLCLIPSFYLLLHPIHFIFLARVR
jgi:hypothetical protein